MYLPCVILKHLLPCIMVFIICGFAWSIPTVVTLNRYFWHQKENKDCLVIYTEIISDHKTNYLMGDLNYINQVVNITDYVELGKGDLSKLILRQENKYVDGNYVSCLVKTAKERIKKLKKYKVKVLEWIWMPFGIILGGLSVAGYIGWVQGNKNYDSIS